MPTPAQILASLTAVANDGIGVAIAWHVLFIASLGALVLGWRPTGRVAGVLLSLLPASVAAFAWIYGNPFNGAALGLLTTVLAWSTLTRPRMTTARAMPWLGRALIVFGWVYPHFLQSKPLITYLIAAPTGLVPCPTLTVLIGVTLLKPTLFSRVWIWTLASYGMFYGLFGALRLGVWLDVGLLVGVAGLLKVVRLRTLAQ